MNRRLIAAAVMLAALLAARPLAAQAPAAEAFLPLVRLSDGSEVGVDTSTWFEAEGDSTWAVERVTRFAAARVEAPAADLRSELEEWSCAHQATRPIGVQWFLRGRLTVAEVHSAAWEPVAEDWLPHFRAVCALLQRPDSDEEPDSVTEVPPRLLNRSDLFRWLSAHYPPLLRDTGVQGQVLMRFRLLADGTIDPASLRIIYATNAPFARTALAATTTMRWAPATVDGVPTKVWITMPLHFELR